MKKAKYIELYYRNGFYKFRTRFDEDHPEIAWGLTTTVQKWKRYRFKLYSRSAGAANEAKMLLLFALEHDLRAAARKIKDVGVDGFHPTVPEDIALNIEDLLEEFRGLFAKTVKAFRDCHA